MQGGDGQVTANATSLTQDQFLWSFNLTVGAGQTVRLLSFAIQAQNRSAAAIEAGLLANLPAKAIEQLTDEVLASILNFDA